MNAWTYLDSGPACGRENMLIDERLLDQVTREALPATLRLYSWDPPAVSVGRFQNSETAVNAETCARRGIDIVRRVTGGRAVLHDRELTYSIVARTSDPLFPGDVLGAYKTIAAGLLAGLKKLGIQAEMVSRSNRHAALVKKRDKEPSCFSSPSWYEVLVNGRKIIGSAQRRVAGAFLQHGSILIRHDPVLEAEVIPGAGTHEGVTSIERELGRDISLEEVKSAFAKGFSDALGIHFIKQG